MIDDRRMKISKMYVAYYERREIKVLGNVWLIIAVGTTSRLSPRSWWRSQQLLFPMITVRTSHQVAVWSEEEGIAKRTFC